MSKERYIEKINQAQMPGEIEDILFDAMIDSNINSVGYDELLAASADRNVHPHTI